jgi:hypothetical protein
MTTTRIRTAIAVLATTVSFGAVAGPAFAEDNIPPLVPGKCAVVDEHGNVSYVSKGTRVGLLYCGADGDWHIGWLVDGIAKPPTHGKSPVSVARVNGALTAARSQR